MAVVVGKEDSSDNIGLSNEQFNSRASELANERVD